MRFGIILQTKEHEKAWNALRFAVTSRKQRHEVKVFLMGEAVECEGLSHPKYDAAAMLKELDEAGGEILACGACLKSRQMEGSEVCPVSTMVECVDMVIWADRVLVF
jgi:sulfur relay (sulfurtransferase) complex TusBCD TusD component (DsrE family)